MTLDYRLYYVTDEALPLQQLCHIVEEAVKGGVTLVQLREKKTSGLVFYEKAKKLKALLAKYEVPLIINDRIDIALAVNADGVHIGQNDLPLPIVKKMVPESMLVGVSVQTADQAYEAEKNGADYLGIGSVFPTKTKKDAKLLPKNKLAEIANAVAIPSVAIGGIDLHNAQQLLDQGVNGIAVVSAITKAKNPFQVAKQFRKAW